MIHELLHLDRPLIVLDTETTSLDPQKARIVEFGAQIWDPEGLRKEWRTLVRPDVPIPKDAVEVHGITDERLQLCNRCASTPEMHPIGLGDTYCGQFHSVPRFCDLAPNLAGGMVDCDFAGKNIRFDIQVLMHEFVRAGVVWSYVGARIVDADRLEQLGEPRTLSHLYEKHLGRKMEGAHGALADVQGTTEVIVAQLTKYVTLPRDLGALHAAQFPGAIDIGGKFRFADGVPRVMFGKHRLKPMRDVDPGYWDWILSADFPPDVKAIARAAKLGQFPEERG